MSNEIAHAVVEAIAAVEGTKTTDLDTPLTEYVEPDAVETLYHHDNDDLKVTFETENHHVEVTGIGEVRVDYETVVTGSSIE